MRNQPPTNTAIAVTEAGKYDGAERGAQQLPKNGFRRPDMTSVGEATVDFAALMARLEAVPFQNRTAFELFSKL